MLIMLDDDEKELRDALNRNDPIQYTRKLPWKNGTIECIGQSGDPRKFHSLSADFFYVSSRKKYVACGRYRILLNEKHEILWIGKHEDDHFFIMSDDQVYALWYEHGILCIMSTICKISGNSREADDAYLDGLINKYNRDIDNSRYNGGYTYTRLPFREFMEKEFYLRGPLWQDGKYPNDITVLNRITNCHNGLLRIDLKNSTYPFDAWVVFDIAKLKIVDGKANIPAKTDKPSNSLNDGGIYEKIKNILVDVFRIDESMIKMDANIKDFGYYHMDYTGVGTAMEYLDLEEQVGKCFNIKTTDNEYKNPDDDFMNLKTVRDLYEYVERKGTV